MRVDTDIEEPAESHWQRLRFIGKGSEYFLIWIVNLVLTIVTLGLFSPWAKVRAQKYFCNKTILDGASFDYHAGPLAILKWRAGVVFFLGLVAAGAFVNPFVLVIGAVMFLLLIPWAVSRAFRFNAQMTSYRSVAFDFDGKTSTVYWFLLLAPAIFALAGMVTGAWFSSKYGQVNAFGKWVIDAQTAKWIGISVGLYLALPYVHRSLSYYRFNFHLFGRGRFRARLGIFRFYIIYLLSTITALLIVSLVSGIAYLTAMLVSVRMLVRMESEYRMQVLSQVPEFVLLIILPTILCLVLLRLNLVSRLRNYSVGQLKLQSAASFNSEMRLTTLLMRRSGCFLLLIATLGLAWPWIRIWMLRYRIETIGVRIYGSVEGYATEQKEQLAEYLRPIEEFNVALNVTPLEDDKSPH